MKKETTPPWKKKRQNTGKKKTKLTPEQIEAAKDRAFANGRRYPNLIDNMWAARYVPRDVTDEI